MIFLKKENWVLDFIFMIFTFGTYIVLPAYGLNLYEKDKWYSNYKYWLFGALALVFPVVIMLIILVIQMTVKVAKKLDVSGSSIYDNVYVWIGLLIVPVVGWILLIVMYIYLQVFSVLQIKQGNV